MSQKNKSLKELIAEFDSIVVWFDAMNDEFDVEKAIEQYKKGAKVADEIKARLEQAKNEVEVVNKNGSDL